MCGDRKVGNKMKQILSFLLVLIMCMGLNVTALAAPNPIVQELADEAYEIGTQQGLEGDALQEFIQNYIRENMPHDVIEQDHQDYINSSYQDKLVRYNEWKDTFSIYSYNSIVVEKEKGYIEYKNFAQEQTNRVLSGMPSLPNEERYLLKPIYDCVTTNTLDGYLLTKTFDGEYSLFSLEVRDFITTYDKKYDLSCGSLLNLLTFPAKPVYDVNDTENLRLLGQEPYMLPAKDTTTGKYGFINWHSGEVEIPFIYDGAKDFYEGVAAVKKGDYWGYIDSDNNMVLDFKYNQAEGFNNGIAQAGKSLIDKKGNVLVTAQHSTLKMLGSDYYMSYAFYLNPVSKGYHFSMDIYNLKGEMLYEVTIPYETNTNDIVAKHFKYLGNNKLQYTFLDEEVVLDIPQTPISGTTTTATSVSNSNTPDAKFTDVPSNAWYYDAVYKVKDLGIIAGKGDGLFDPNGNLTVAEGITLAARVRANYNQEEIPSVSGEWYAGALEYGVAQGILKNGDFTDYNKKITRAEMAYLFSNALPSTEYTSINQITALPDVSANTKYQDSIFKLYNAGIVSGSDNYGTFNPNSNIQRSETAAIILRVVDKTERKSLSLEPFEKTPSENTAGAITITEGQTRSNRPAKAGDTVIKSDGTKVTLKLGPNGVLGEGQGVAADLGLQSPSGFDTVRDQERNGYSGWGQSSVGVNYINDYYYVNPLTGEGHWGAEWQVIQDKTYPDYDGKVGEISKDKNYIWNETGIPCWMLIACNTYLL